MYFVIRVLDEIVSFLEDRGLLGVARHLKAQAHCAASVLTKGITSPLFNLWKNHCQLASQAPYAVVRSPKRQAVDAVDYKRYAHIQA